MIRIILLYILVQCILPNEALCQQLSVFKTLTVKQGLPSNFVFDASEDENGVLWIATDKGIAKYDGFKWQLIDKEMGLPGNYINFLACDGKGGIWLSISAKGIYYYDIYKNTSTLVTKKNEATDFGVSKAGILYLYYYNNPINTFSVYSYSKNDLQNGKLIYEMPFISCDTCANNINIDINNKIITHFEIKPTYKNPAQWKISFKSGFEKQLIAGTATDSFFYAKGSIFIHKKDKIIAKKIFGSKGYFFSTAKTNIIFCWDIVHGFWQIDAAGNSKQYTTKDGLASNLVNKILITKKKEVLICTLGGGLQMLLSTNNRKINTNEKQVRAITVNKNIAYVCTENKLLVIDLLQKKEVKSFALHESSIESIAVKGNEIAIGSLTGLNIYNINNSALVKSKNVKIGAGVSTVFNTQNNYLMSTYGSGIQTINKSNELVAIKGIKKYALLEKLQELKNGYAGLTYEDGVHFFNKNIEAIYTLNTNNGLLSNEVYDVHEYKDSFWISNAKGITVYTNFKFVKNIPLTNRSKLEKCIYSFHNKEGKYWVVTNKGLYACNNEKLFFIGSYALTNNERDFLKSVLYDAVSNTLISGSDNEISLLNMSNIVKDTVAIEPSLLFAKANDETTYLKNNFSLPYNFNVVSFSLIPNISNPFSQTSIQYKLEGFNETFQNLSDSTSISFKKLRPGNYALIVKTINIDGYESNEIELIQFKINKPIWLQTWFIILSVIAIVFSSFLLFNYFQRKKQIQKDKVTALALSISKERERISKDLHDHLGTSLVTMIAQTDNIENKLINNNVADALLKVQQLADQSRESMNVLRETIWAVQENSHTLNEFTLRVRTFLQRVMDAHEMSWALECNGTLQKNISAEQTLHLFRMIQEVTQNIIKHAQATHAQYSINANTQSLKITITDDGKGFDTNVMYTSNGLKNLAARIKELDGEINITSALQKGTTIIVQLSI